MRSAFRFLTLAAVATTALLAPSAGAAGETIQPGVYSVSGDSACTLNFVYDGIGANSGRTYIGTAAHCVDKIGDDVSLGSGEVFGDVAFKGDPDATAPDYAFIEVRPEFLSRLSPAVKGHPSYPTGVTSAQDTLSGDDVQISGYGMGYDLTTQTQEQRTAILGYDDAQIYDLIGPIHWGDSGGPLVHIPSGKALGIVSRLCLGTCTEEGPTVEGLIAHAAGLGFEVSLRTV